MAMMKTEIRILGLTHKSGKDDNGKAYDYYKVHIAYDDKWTTGEAVAAVNCTTPQVEDRPLFIGQCYEAILSTDKGRISAYII